MDNNDQDLHIKSLSDAVLRKIGRNVLLFQQIEGMLKFLISNQRVVTVNENGYVEKQQQGAKNVQKQMLGNLVVQYIDNILSDAGDPPSEKESEDVTQLRITTTFAMPVDSDLRESFRADLALMVNERNDLIHHFLSRWQPDSLEGMTGAASYLDQQREKVLPMFEHLKSVKNAMLQGMNEMMAVLDSDEFQRQFELGQLQASPLVALVMEVATQKARSDGWTYLAHAGHFAHIHEPDAVTHMKERYGYSTLKQLLIASEFFDVWDEPLSNGRFHTLYRLKKELKH